MKQTSLFTRLYAYKRSRTLRWRRGSADARRAGGVGGWGGGRGRMDVGIVLGGGMYRKMATEATAMGEAMEAMATGEARRVMMAGAARATATATTKTAVLSAKML